MPTPDKYSGVSVAVSTVWVRAFYTEAVSVSRFVTSE